MPLVGDSRLLCSHKQVSRVASLPLSLLQEVEVGAPAEARPFFFFFCNVRQGQSGLGSWPARTLRDKAYALSKSRRVTRQPLERSQTKPMKVGYKEDWSGTPVGLILQTDIFLGDILGTE